MIKIVSSICLGVILLSCVNTVDRNNFKTCQQSSFCRRHRALEAGVSPYKVLFDTAKISDTSFQADVLQTKNNVLFTLELYGQADSTFRVKFNEKSPIYPRFEEPYALIDLKTTKIEVVDKSSEKITVKFDDNVAIIYSSPLRIDFFKGDTLVISVNARGLLKFEHYRTRKGEAVQQEGEAPAPPPPEEAEEADEDGMWEETFKGHTDTKPRGPSSLGVDISFIDVGHVYGIPEHADSFSLKETESTDPYRLYNLDVFEFELWNPMALYASIPVMYGHSSKHSAAIFWHNAAETWVDIKKSPSTDMVSSITGFFGSSAEVPQVSTHWMSESGIIDLFVMLGPRPMDTFRQFSHLTGVTPLPPMFSLGYHQCRWNYNDQKDVEQVHNNFDKHNLPMDAIWLDIEHTDGKRYFTWDEHKFPDPLEMTSNLTARGRKLVTIVDPHIKIDDNYFFYKENKDLDFYVKNKDGNTFDGWCWPGSSSYIDFTNAKAREHYVNTFSLDRYKGSTLDTFTWNDMNEPSVFNGPEVTMQKDNIHPGLNVEHREMHNVNALLFHSATYEGHLKRSNGKLRPWILTRGAYAGSQRTTAIWTGDNTATYDHLRSSIPMFLSLSISGLTHVGADVGGFFGNPDEYLLSRWYQAAAYTPFYRAHAHLDTRRREPWLFSPESLDIIREALRSHYRLLPYWYTLFYENEIAGLPPMRPIFAEFPTDEGSFDRDDSYMVGSGYLIRPVTEEGVDRVSVYFPPAKWIDIQNRKSYQGPTTLNVEAPRHKIPVYQKVATIIPTKERMRRSSTLMRNDPYTLNIALDSTQMADGTLYIDDEHTFDYRSGHFLYLRFTYKDGVLTCKKLDPAGNFATKSWLERVVIWGLAKEPSAIVMKSTDGKTVELEGTYVQSKGAVVSELVIRKPAIIMTEEFTITLK